MFGRKKVAMLVAEFLGTYALAGAVFALAGRSGFPFFPAAAAGVTLGVMVLTFGAASGAHFNPAVTFGLWTLRKVPTSQALVYMAVQIFAGFVALQVNQRLLDETITRSVKANWDWRIVVAEAIGTFVFTFGIAAAIYSKAEGGRLAAMIGASLFVGVLVASYGASGWLNPAVALAANSLSASYIVGPLLGAVLGMNTYALLFAPEKSSRRK